MRKKRRGASLLWILIACLFLTGCTDETENTAVQKEEKTEAEDLQKERQVEDDAEDSQAEYTGEVFAMDTYMTLTAYGKNAREAVDAGIEEIHRLDDLLSIGSEDSEVSRLNAAGGGTLSEETCYLVERAL